MGRKGILTSGPMSSSEHASDGSNEPFADVGRTIEESVATETSGFVDEILQDAIQEGASDVHIEPYAKKWCIRFRLDGVLIEKPKYGGFLSRHYSACVARLKILADVDIAERRLPQDGKISAQATGSGTEIRCSFLPTKHGERVALRLLPTASEVGGLSGLAISQYTATELKRAISSGQGLVLVTGPTGSGKSTTLAACIHELNSPDRNILTVEDPVEYQISGVGQVQVQEDIGYTFAAALRSFLRQDPEVILVGEMRDVETADIAIKASLTGHLVLSTLHTNDAISTLVRLSNMGMPNYLVATSLNLVVSQRLVRKLCDNCAQVANSKERAMFKAMSEVNNETPDLDTQLYSAVGCKNCQGTGYSGRFALFETLRPSKNFRQAIKDDVSNEELLSLALADGFKPITHQAVDSLRRGLTSVSEIHRIFGTEV